MSGKSDKKDVRYTSWPKSPKVATEKNARERKEKGEKDWEGLKIELVAFMNFIWMQLLDNFKIICFW